MKPLLLFLLAFAAASPHLTLTDVTTAAGLRFTHNNGAYGSKLLPETLGPGCAFLDYDRDGHLDILFINGQSWPGHAGPRSTPQLYRNNGNGTFTDRTVAAGLDTPLYGLGVAVADYNNDGWPDLLITAVGQSRLYRNTNGRFTDVTTTAGLANHTGLSTSALWFDANRDGHLDLFIANYVRWSPTDDVHCSLDGRNKSYCTPEAYKGATSWFFRNRGNGTFEDATARSGIFDPSSKSLGAAIVDFDGDGWLDLFVANDTQPNKLYRNNHDNTFTESAVRLGIAFSEDGKARAGMGVDVVDLRRTGRPTIAVTNFDNEMLGLYEWNGSSFIDRAMPAGLGIASRDRLGFGCLFGDLDLDGWTDLVVMNGHIDDTVRNIGRRISHAQVPHLFLSESAGQRFTDVATQVGAAFATPKIGRGIALGDYDNDGDLDILATTNGGPGYLYRNDLATGHHALRLTLEGTRSNRDAIGAVVQVQSASGIQTQMVKSGSSYLSSSERTLTFGMAQDKQATKVTVYWPSGHIDRATNLAVGPTWRWREASTPQR
jgi:hypothetical protein